MFNRVGAMTVDARINGLDLGPQTFHERRRFHLHARRSAGALLPTPSPSIFPSIKGLPPSDPDPRELAVIVTTVGLTSVNDSRRSRALLRRGPSVCLILFWRVPLTWFPNDDFAWLGLPLEVHSARNLFTVLFTPKAQGTIRVLSERLFFLTFSSSSDFTPCPITSVSWRPGSPISRWPH